MSETQKVKKSFADKVNAVKNSAPLEEKQKVVKKVKKSIGQPKKADIDKQNISITIHVNIKGLQEIEEKSIAAGYIAKDRAKWLKNLALSDSNTEAELTSLKTKLAKLNKELQAKNSTIEKITQKLLDKM